MALWFSKTPPAKHAFSTPDHVGLPPQHYAYQWYYHVTRVNLRTGTLVQVNRTIGLGPTLLYAALAVAALFWADTFVREAALLPLPGDALKYDAKGTPVRCFPSLLCSHICTNSMIL